MTTSPVGARQRLVIEDFPRPDLARTLSPNGRAHWAKKREAAHVVMQFVWSYAADQKLQPMQGLVVLRPTFIYPQKRARDDDNLATGVMKVVRDALVKGKYLIADDAEHLRQMPVEIHVERGQRALVLEFEVGS